MVHFMAHNDWKIQYNKQVTHNWLKIYKKCLRIKNMKNSYRNYMKTKNMTNLDRKEKLKISLMTTYCDDLKNVNKRMCIHGSAYDILYKDDKQFAIKLYDKCSMNYFDFIYKYYNIKPNNMHFDKLLDKYRIILHMYAMDNTKMLLRKYMRKYFNNFIISDEAYTVVNIIYECYGNSNEGYNLISYVNKYFPKFISNFVNGACIVNFIKKIKYSKYYTNSKYKFYGDTQIQYNINIIEPFCLSGIIQPNIYLQSLNNGYSTKLTNKTICKIFNTLSLNSLYKLFDIDLMPFLDIYVYKPFSVNVIPIICYRFPYNAYKIFNIDKTQSDNPNCMKNITAIFKHNFQNIYTLNKQKYLYGNINEFDKRHYIKWAVINNEHSFESNFTKEYLQRYILN